MHSLRIVENYAQVEDWIANCSGDLMALCKGIAKLLVVDIALSRDMELDFWSASLWRPFRWVHASSLNTVKTSEIARVGDVYEKFKAAENVIKPKSLHAKASET